MDSGSPETEAWSQSKTASSSLTHAPEVKKAALSSCRYGSGCSTQSTTFLPVTWTDITSGSQISFLLGWKASHCLLLSSREFLPVTPNQTLDMEVPTLMVPEWGELVVHLVQDF